MKQFWKSLSMFKYSLEQSGRVSKSFSEIWNSLKRVRQSLRKSLESPNQNWTNFPDLIPGESQRVRRNISNRLIKSEWVLKYPKQSRRIWNTSGCVWRVINESRRVLSRSAIVVEGSQHNYKWSLEKFQSDSESLR